MLNSDSKLTDQQWKRSLLNKLGLILKDFGFKKEANRFWRSGLGYWEAYEIPNTKYFFIHALHQPGSLPKPFAFNSNPAYYKSMCHIDLIIPYSIFGGSGIPSKSYYDDSVFAVAISETILLISNKIAAVAYQQEPPHELNFENQICCHDNFEYELITLREYTSSPYPLPDKLPAHDLLNLVVGDCGISMPDGWKIISRHERYFYDDEFRAEYGSFIRLSNKEYDDELISYQFLRDIFHTGMFVIFAVKEDRLLIITETQDRPLVSVKIDWSGDSAVSFNKLNPCFYSSFEEFSVSNQN